MASDPAESLRAAPMDGDAKRAPLAGSRSQSVQRLQIGLFGLGAMVLLVGLANIILTNARQNEALVVPEAAPTVAAQPSGAPASDPLADAGVVPSTTEQPGPQAGAAARPAGDAAVP